MYNKNKKGFKFMFNFKDFFKKHFDYVVLTFIVLILSLLVYLSIEDSKNTSKILEKNGRYAYINNLDFNFFKEKDFLDENKITNEEFYLYSIYLNINKFNDYKEKCDLNGKGDIISYRFFNNKIGIQEKRFLYVDTKQLLKYNEKDIYTKLKNCISFTIKDFKENKEILPEKKNLLEIISTKLKNYNQNK